jgi:hypothetical protein
MTLKYGIFCLLGLFIAVLLALKNYETWTGPVSGISVPEKGAPKKPGGKPETPPPQGERKDQDSIASYIAISEKNPFHPDRTEFPVLAQPEAAKEVKKAIVRPQVTLYGVTLAGDYQSASVSYPGRPIQKGEREVVNVKIGDRVGEYKLAKIAEDRIVLEAPEDGFEVLLYDGKAPKKRVYVRTESKPAAVTSAVPGTPEAPKPGGPTPAVVPARPAAPVTPERPAAAGVPGKPRTPIRPGIAEAPGSDSSGSTTPYPPGGSRTRRFNQRTSGGE